MKIQVTRDAGAFWGERRGETLSRREGKEPPSRRKKRKKVDLVLLLLCSTLVFPPSPHALSLHSAYMHQLELVATRLFRPH
jgi:hypothetical protein